jgi:hypothetical protein
MNLFGFLLLVGGFLLGAYATALDVEAVNWMLFAPGVVVAALGVALTKRHARSAATSEQVLTANKAELRTALDNIVVKLDRLTADRAGLKCSEVLQRIDRDLRDDLRRFADARESMVHLYGIQVYADVMSDFASGERFVNRVWSAAADGYGDEVTDYLGRAGSEFRHARAGLEAARSRVDASIS